jgi:arylsulfatase A-like enzyme
MKPLRLSLVTALAWGLSLAWLDVARASMGQKILPESALMLLGSVTAVFAIGFASCLGAAAIGLVLARLTPLGTTAAVLAAGTLTGVPLLLRVLGFETAIPEWRQWGTVWLPAFLGLTAFALALLAVAGGEGNRRTVDLAYRLGLVAPLVFIEMFVLQWLRQELLQGGLLKLAGWFVWLVTVAGTVWIFGRRGRIAHASAMLLLAAVGLVAATAGTWALERRPPVFPEHRHDGAVRRILLVTIDTLRWDALSVHGSTNPTPNIDRLADDSVLFTAAHSPGPWTVPGVTSLMTGVSPWTHRLLHMNERLPAGLPLLAERLRDAGYLTGATGFNYFLSPGYTRGSLERGFDHYDFFPVVHRPETFGAWLVDELRSRAERQRGDTDDLTRRAEEWVRGQAGQDFFLWLHYFDPHVPYAPPAEFFPPGEPDARVGDAFTAENGLERVRAGLLRPDAQLADWTRRLYDAEVRYVDDRLGRLLDTLKELALYDDTLIVLTSDHGEEIFDHGGIDHGHTLYQELLHVPLMIKPPGSHPAHRVDRPVSTERLVPTLLDLAGLPFRAEEFTGTSLVPLWQDPEASPDAPDPAIFSTGMYVFDDRRSVIFEGFKYVLFDEWPREELYDLRADPAEQRNLVEERPDLVAEGRARLDAWAERNDALREAYGLTEGETFESDEAELELLRSLGYVN